MGSVVALDASGSHWPAYGSARRHVRELEVVLADGQIVRLSRHACRRRRSTREDEPGGVSGRRAWPTSSRAIATAIDERADAQPGRSQRLPAARPAATERRRSTWRGCSSAAKERWRSSPKRRSPPCRCRRTPGSMLLFFTSLDNAAAGGGGAVDAARCGRAT